MEADDRRWMRDLGALLALPSLWVDHAPAEIADGLLSVLVGVLRLDAAYARFEVPGGTERIEGWRPTGAEAPDAFVEVLRAVPAPGSAGGAGIAFPEGAAGFATAAVRTTDVRSETAGAITRVASLALALPWESARVLVAASRPDFPTDRETHLFRVAVGQAAIALHTSRRLSAEQRARRAAEQALERQSAALRSLLEDVGPALATASRRVRQASREAGDPSAPAPLAGIGSGVGRGEAGGSVEWASAVPLAAEGSAQRVAALTRRELEVLGLLAQGLSNKEIAGVMWLSDRTVERHITSLYRKIGVARRSEATAFALRHGVV